MGFEAELDGLARRLAPRDSRGRTVMLAPVTPGAGASTLAGALARAAARHCSRPVWLFDLDFLRNCQSMSMRLNGQGYAGELEGLRFWRAEPDQAGRLAMRRVEDAPVFVSRFEREPGAVRRLTFHSSKEYWRLVRRATPLAFLDAPHDSPAIMALAGDIDGVILVADARTASAEAADEKAARIEEAGGRVLGVIVNRSGRRSA